MEEISPTRCLDSDIGMANGLALEGADEIKTERDFG